MTNEPVREPAGGDPKRMLSRARWEAECRLMAKYFPEFTPYAADGVVGLRGKLRGPRTARIYDVAIQARIDRYPRTAPSVFMTPRPEPHFWNLDGSLSMLVQWHPRKSTFASILVIVAKYLAEFDGDNNNWERTSLTSTGEQEQ